VPDSSISKVYDRMSESRPLVNTLQQPQVTTCPLFIDGPETRAPNWSVSTFGLVVVAMTLAEASVRLGVRAVLTVHAVGKGLHSAQYLLLALSVLAFGYGEGYRALHRRFVPHVIDRATTLARTHQRRLRDWLAAPLYMLCLVQAEPRVLRRGWLSVFSIVCAVVAVRELPEPYRGIIDAGVAVALGIGLFSLICGYVAAVRSKQPAQG
jgi:hypothetical protein